MQPAGERDIRRTTTEPPSTQAPTGHDGPFSISVEALAWTGLLVAAGLLRLADLDGLPLTVDEAARATDAVRVAHGVVPETWRGDLSAAATSYLFRIFGTSEFVARIIPALAGLALVAAFWWTRPHIGRTGALVAAVLVTFSPLFVLHSRTATEYAVGPMLSVIIVVSVFEYLRSPRTTAAFALLVSLALAPLIDAPAVLTVLAVMIFIGLEASVFCDPEPALAWRVFRSSPVQWISALLVLGAALQLGLTHFGTSLDKTELPGLRLLVDMFELPRDSRPAEYHFALLLAYDWPLLLAGAGGFALLAFRFARRQALAPCERLLLLWTLVAAAALILATRREPGQLLILLVPLALVAGRLAQELATSLDWDILHRWAPAAAILASIVALAALLMTEWSSGNVSSDERYLLAAAPLGALALLAAIFLRSRAGSGAAALAVAIVIAVAFAAHSSLAVAVGDGAEFAVDSRLTPRAEQLKSTLDRLSAERDSAIVLDADLVDELGWTLRNSRAVFGGEPATASILLTRPDADPAGFAGLRDVWRVAEGWYPDDVLAPRRVWRWLLYREPFGPVEFVEVRIYVRTI